MGTLRFSILDLFLRFRNKFKRSINRAKSSEIYSNNLDKINSCEYKITSQNNEDGIIEHIPESTVKELSPILTGEGIFNKLLEEV